MAKQSLEEVVIRFTQTHVYFIRAANELTVSCRLRCSVKHEQIFNEYKMEGFSKEENEMYLKVKIVNLKNAVARIEKSTIMSIKLDGGSAEKSPLLLVILETGLTTVCNKRKVLHKVPITVVAHRKWADYIESPLPAPEVSFYMILINDYLRFSPLNTVYNFVNISNLSNKYFLHFINYRFRLS